MKAYRDLAAPLEAHDLTIDRVRLSFGAEGVLLNPDDEQVAVMTATALRRGRFVEIDPPAPPAPEPAPLAVEESAAPAKAEASAPTGKGTKKSAAAPASDEGPAK